MGNARFAEAASNNSIRVRRANVAASFRHWAGKLTENMAWTEHVVSRFRDEISDCTTSDDIQDCLERQGPGLFSKSIIAAATLDQRQEFINRVLQSQVGNCGIDDLQSASKLLMTATRQELLVVPAQVFLRLQAPEDHSLGEGNFEHLAFWDMLVVPSLQADHPQRFPKRPRSPWASIIARRTAFEILADQLDQGSQGLPRAEPMAQEAVDVNQPPLSDLQQRILIFMLSSDFSSVNKWVKSSTIARKIAAGEDSTKRAARLLVTSGLLNTRRGSGGGYWLTDRGIDVAKPLKPPSNSAAP